MTVAGKEITLIPAAKSAPLIVVIGDHSDSEDILAEVRALTAASFSLAVIGSLDWERELTPWAAPGAFRFGQDYSGEADTFLALLTGEIVPAVCESLAATPPFIVLAGYSLAGLFALYAAHRSDAFRRVAAVSGSFWYPNFADFAAATPLSDRIDRIYLSLGDREAKTKNPALASVETNARRLAADYAARGIDTVFELNSGNHFTDPQGRLAKGIARCVEGVKQ